jgi:hypothetical protein
LVGSRLLTVDVGLTAVEGDPTDVGASPSVVETIRTKVAVRPAVVGWASSVVGIAP